MRRFSAWRSRVNPSTDRPPDDGRGGDNWLPFRGRWRWLGLSLALSFGAFVVFFGSTATCMDMPDNLSMRQAMLFYLACTVGVVSSLLMVVGAILAYRRGRRQAVCPSEQEPNNDPTDSDLGFGS